MAAVLIRTEATGYGCVYFAQNALSYTPAIRWYGKTVCHFGFGQRGDLLPPEKAMQLGAKVDRDVRFRRHDLRRGWSR